MLDSNQCQSIKNQKLKTMKKVMLLLVAIGFIAIAATTKSSFANAKAGNANVLNDKYKACIEACNTCIASCKKVEAMCAKEKDLKMVSAKNYAKNA
jgi:hypothetical protein